MRLRKLTLTLRDAITLAAFVIFGALIVARLDQAALERHTGAFRVSDGDTLSLAGARYRLAGIDAPERAQSCGAGDASWRCGEEARRVLVRLVGEGGVECAGGKRDRYGRLLVVCRTGEHDLNAEMVRLGMAIAYRSADVDYRHEETEARSARRGVWSGPFDRPQDWRRMNGSMADGSFDWLWGFISRISGYDMGHEWED